jgi:hypothetical protein
MINKLLRHGPDRCLAESLANRFLDENKTPLGDLAAEARSENRHRPDDRLLRICVKHTLEIALGASQSGIRSCQARCSKYRLRIARHNKPGQSQPDAGGQRHAHAPRTEKR